MIIVYWYLIGLFASALMFVITLWESHEVNELYSLKYRSIVAYLALALLGPIALVFALIIGCLIVWSLPSVQRFLNRKVF